MVGRDNDKLSEGGYVPPASYEKSPKILSLGQDWLFKYVFGNSENKDILRDFLLTILRIPPEEFKRLTYTNTDLLRTSEDDKLSILDVRVETVSGYDIDIEIQIADMEGMRERIVYYASKMLASHLHEGDRYVSVKKTIVIVIAHFNWFKEEDNYYHRFLLRDEETGYVFSDIMEVNTIELPKLPKNPEQTVNIGLWNWAALLAAHKEEEFDMLAERSPEIGKVVGILKELSADEMVRMQYEARQKALRDQEARLSFAERVGMEKGIERGIEQGIEQGIGIGAAQKQREIAKNFIALGIDALTVSKASGLSLADIKSLQS